MIGRPSTVATVVAMSVRMLSASVARLQPDHRAVAHIDSANIRFPSMLFSGEAD